MAQKNDTPVLVGSLLITLALIGGGIWWFTQRSGFNFSNAQNSGTSTPNSDTTGTNPQVLPTGQSGAQTLGQVQNVPSGLFSYGGSTTWAPIRGRVDPAIQNAQPGFQLRYTDPIGAPPGSGIGIQMLIQGQLAFAQSSLPLQQSEIEQAQQRGFSLTQLPVAIEGIAIAVHPNLNIPGITLDQLRQIYLGQITNWNQVGGANLPITPYSRRQDGGTVEFFIKNVLGGQNFGNNVQFIGTTTQAIRAVSANPGALYYASAPEVVGQCTTKPLPLGRQANQLIASHQGELVLPSQCPAQRNQINTDAFRSGQYPLTRQLFVIVKQNGQIEQQVGEAYANLLLTNEGQNLLSEAGFVRIR
jgi:phosphate transport system substrate-binding protein